MAAKIVKKNEEKIEEMPIESIDVESILHSALEKKESDIKKKYKKEFESLAEKRQEKLKIFLAAIEKAKGKGTITIAANAEYKEIPRISTGILALDYALGGGWARGRINLVCGKRSSCKTRTAIATIAEAQRKSVVNDKYLAECTEEEKAAYSCLYIDAEGTFSPAWAENCGIDLAVLHIARPVTLEESSDILISATTSGAYDLIVLDSLAQLMCEDDIEAASDEKTFGTASAKKNNNTLKKLQALMNKMEQDGHAPTILIINQLREKIGVPAYLPASMKKYRPGGIAQEYVTSIIVEMWDGKVDFFDEAKQYPSKIAFGFYVDKNKVSTPKAEGEFIMAVADSPNGEFKKGEILERKVVWDYCMRFEIIKRLSDTTMGFKNEVFKTQKAIWEKYFLDDANYLVVKKEILGILCPKR
jgi:recombination protein RecA